MQHFVQSSPWKEQSGIPAAVLCFILQVDLVADLTKSKRLQKPHSVISEWNPREAFSVDELIEEGDKKVDSPGKLRNNSPEKHGAARLMLSRVSIGRCVMLKCSWARQLASRCRSKTTVTSCPKCWGHVSRGCRTGITDYKVKADTVTLVTWWLPVPVCHCLMAAPPAEEEQMFSRSASSL